MVNATSPTDEAAPSAIKLTAKHIKLDSSASSKEEAIREAGLVLVNAGNIAPGYIESMLGREVQANTYLGNGIAIPHGLQKDRELIRKTGVSIVQVPGGVEWNEGQMVHIVVAIAAKSDEHLEILAALTDVLDDSNMADRLAKTDDPADIIKGLTRRREPEAGQPMEEMAGAHHIDVTLVGDAGLHARPATFFVDVAKEFESEIRIQYKTRFANGKAMASLLKLGVEGGETIRIVASGPDAKEALHALESAVESGLGEEEEKTPAVSGLAWTPVSHGRSIAGVSASPGLAIGQLFQYQTTRIVVTDKRVDDLEAEKKKIKSAIETAMEQLGDIYDSVADRAGKSEATIFRAHQALLSDEDLCGEVFALIGQGHSAAWSWQRSIEERVDEVKVLQNERMAGRAMDLHDVGQRVLRLLADTEHNDLELPDENVILVADDLTPSDTAKLDPKRIIGLCTASGGPTSHTAIIARSLDIPAVVGAGASVLEQTCDVACILDGTAGILYINPSKDNLKSARSFQIDLHFQRDQEAHERYQPANLTDGHRVEIVANIGNAAEATVAVEAGAEGVGLLRTEFMFLERKTPPSEEEQFKSYSSMTKALNGLPLIIRTLDIGGDKVLPYLTLAKEENPFLGVRGIRLCLRKKELFLPQLRAIYRAANTGPVKMMFPMVATLDELLEAKELAEKVRVELGAPKIEIGIMIEVPAAAVMAAELAEEVDFFSIGTNDLTQYVLAMDRMHPALGKSVDGLNPAVLRMIDMTVRAAEAKGKWVGVCGGVAGDPIGAAILTGLGVSELSMAIPSVAAVKAYLRKISLTSAKSFAKKALACGTAREVRQLRLP